MPCILHNNSYAIINGRYFIVTTKKHIKEEIEFHKPINSEFHI